MENKSPFQDITVEETIEIVYNALINKGYDPISQFAGYILSEDPLYIPDWENARGAISHVERDELLKLLIQYYFETRFSDISAKSNNENDG
jgi:uncharacterized protein (UPF0297 family)